MSLAVSTRYIMLRAFRRSYASATESVASTTSTRDDFNFDDLVETLGRTATSTSNKGLSYAAMLRKSKFMQLGDFRGRIVIGNVARRVADDLYIDFGLKFNAVCKAPATNNELFVRGAQVVLRLRDPELSERFLGSAKDLTLLEADADIIRLLNSPAGSVVKKNRAENISKGEQVADSPSTQ